MRDEPFAHGLIVAIGEPLFNLLEPLLDVLKLVRFEPCLRSAKETKLR